MIKVITYGTYDLLHYGHIRLLERAKALGDYLIVGVTADDFDKTRGKINVKQSLMERVEAVRATGIADEIIIEEYEGQKIDDIKRCGVDIFTVGSDWKGKFDYLNEYCKVVYLDRTEGVSSSELRTETNHISLGIIGDSNAAAKYARECEYVNGLEVTSIFTNNPKAFLDKNFDASIFVNDYKQLLEHVEAIYIESEPSMHYEQIKEALREGKHVLCESPITLSLEQTEELFEIAKSNNCILMNSIKTAYSTAYSRLLLLVKSGKIGRVISIDATCTSLSDFENESKAYLDHAWNSICSWGPTALLPVLQILGSDYKKKHIVSKMSEQREKFDLFSKIDFLYENAVATIKVGKGVKSEGELIISGTKGYIYVPAPWWKTDYFEIRYENPADNKRYFYQLDGEGIRYELVAFKKAVETGKADFEINTNVSNAICKVIEDFYKKVDMNEFTD